MKNDLLIKQYGEYIQYYNKYPVACLSHAFIYNKFSNLPGHFHMQIQLNNVLDIRSTFTIHQLTSFEPYIIEKKGYLIFNLKSISLK